MQQSFLQSQTWEAFQQAVGFETARVNGALLIKKPLIFGKSYWYCPRADVDVERVRQLAARDGVIFLRIDPLTETHLASFSYAVRRVTHVQPPQTIVVGLQQSEDMVLQQMHAKTRYNIRLGQRKGVTVRIAGADEFPTFWRLMQDTAERDQFRGHGQRYYRTMVETCAAGDADMFVRMYVAEYAGAVIAAGLFAFYGSMVTYVHGASSNQHRNVMAPYALHWQVMRDAKHMGYTQYDLYGIDEKKWPGVTRFKRGFGGEEVTRPETHDVLFNRIWYSGYQLVRRLRRAVL